jgi:hypothetical protein
MLVCYVRRASYFQSRGGYTAVHLTAEENRTHSSHQEPGGLDRDVTADETIADGAVGPTA